MSEADYTTLLEDVIEIAARASSAILEVYGTDIEIETKDDASPLTAADRASNEVIREGLSALDPAYPIWSEESAQSPLAVRKEWPSFWLVDPLDGTKEFIKRNGEFTVNIALICGHEPVLGVVHVPAQRRVFFGARGVGAFCRHADGKQECIFVAAPAAAPRRVVGSRSHPSPDLQTYLDAIGEHVLVPMGSSLKLCLIASGEADVYPRLGPTSEWDTAAAHAVVEAAGGRVVDLSGAPLRYNTKESALNPHFIAFGDGDVDWLPRQAS